MTRPDGIEIKKLINNSFASHCVLMDGSLPLASFYLAQWLSELQQNITEFLLVLSTSFPFCLLTKTLLLAGKTPSHCMENLTVQDQESDSERTKPTMGALMLI